MRSNVLSFSPANTSNTGFATGLTGSTGPFTTFNTPTDGAHLVALTSAANLSATNFTIVGTDAEGRTITEVRAGPNASTVLTTNFFRTITSITASVSLAANTLDVGWQDDFCSKPYPCDYFSQNGLNMSVVPTGTVNFTVQETFGPIFDTSVVLTWNDLTALASKTATTTAAGTPGATAMRIKTNSYTNGATLKIFTSQPSPQH